MCFYVERLAKKSVSTYQNMFNTEYQKWMSDGDAFFSTMLTNYTTLLIFLATRTIKYLKGIRFFGMETADLIESSLL